MTRQIIKSRNETPNYLTTMEILSDEETPVDVKVVLQRMIEHDYWVAHYRTPCETPIFRLYSDGLQQLPSEIRKKITGGFELDVENCYPSLLSQITHDTGLACPILDEYVMNRDKYLALDMEHFFISRTEAKNIYFSAIFDEECDYETVFSQRLRREIKKIIRTFYSFNKFDDLRNMKYNTSLCSNYSTIGRYTDEKTCLLALILERAERTVLDVMVDSLEEYGVKVIAELFDGVLVGGQIYVKIINDVERQVKKQTGFNITLKIK